MTSELLGIIASAYTTVTPAPPTPPPPVPPTPPSCTPSCGAWSYTYGAWSAYSECSNGTQTRTRTVTGTRTCTASDCSTYTETSTSTETESQSCSTVTWYCSATTYGGSQYRYTSSTDDSVTTPCVHAISCSTGGYPGYPGDPGC